VESVQPAFLKNWSRLNAKLRGGPIALPEKRPPKSITFTMFVRFCPSTWKLVVMRSDLYRSAPADALT
jgi:hypothetical protein